MISSTSNHEDLSICHHSETVVRRCFIKKLSLIIYKNLLETICAGVFFNKVAILNLLKIDSSTGVFSVNFLQYFEEHLF